MVKIRKDGRLEMTHKDARNLTSPKCFGNGEENKDYPKDVYDVIDGWCKGKNGKAYERLADRVSLARVVDELDDMICALRTTYKSILGCTISFDPNGQRFPNSYKWVAMSSIVMLTITREGKFVFDIVRERCHTDRKIFFVGHLPESVIKDIKNNF